MFSVEVKYRGKPIKVNKKTGKLINHVSVYTVKAEEYGYENNWAKAMRKEITKITKKYKGIYSIRFYV